MTFKKGEMLQVITAQTKLITELTLEIIELEQKLESREYNRRFTNTKFKKIDATPLVGLEPKFTATINPKKVQRK